MALTVDLTATWKVRLTVDAVRRQTLLAMAAAWRETAGEDDISEALGRLADISGVDTTEGEEDAAVEAVEDAACLPYPTVDLSLREAKRLRDELDAAIRRATIPGQARQGGEAA
jgi:hypothetical protein